MDRQKGLCPCFSRLVPFSFLNWGYNATIAEAPGRTGRDTAALSPQDIIDLTYEDINTDPTLLRSLDTIDLTKDTCSPVHSTLGATQNPRNTAPAAHLSHPQLCPTAEEMQAMAEPNPAPASYSTHVKLSSNKVTAEIREDCSCLSPVSRCHSWSSEQDYSTTAFNSYLDLQSDSDCLSPSPPSLDSNRSWRADGPEEDPSQPYQEKNVPPRLSPAPTIPITPGKAQRSLLETNDFPSHQPIQQVTPARTDTDSKARLDKLQNFSRSGAQHLFLQGIAPNKETQQVNRVWSSLCGRGWRRAAPAPLVLLCQAVEGSGYCSSLHSGPHITAGFLCVEGPFTHCLALYTAET